MNDIEKLSLVVKDFCEERDWDQFHDPKELSIGMSTEANELLEIFRFKTKDQMAEMMKDPETRKEISGELADVFYFLLRFSQMNNFDLEKCLLDKMERNKDRYTVEKAKGNNKKYSEDSNK